MTWKEPSPSEQPPAFQTDLIQSPLPEILVTVHRHKVPGTIECRRGNEHKEIFFDQGHIIFATSNQVRDSLGDKLLAEGKITREQYEESVRRLLATGKRQGTVLTEMGVLDPASLFISIREQIQEIVWSVFSWDGGTVGFHPGRARHQEFVKLDIGIPQAVMLGVRFMPDAKELLARIGSKTTLLVRLENEVPGLVLGDDEQRLLDAVDGRTPLYDLVNTPPQPPTLNARLLYGFFALQLVAVKAPIKVQLKTDGGSFQAG